MGCQLYDALIRLDYMVIVNILKYLPVSYVLIYLKQRIKLKMA